jgi:hypothetical protein
MPHIVHVGNTLGKRLLLFTCTAKKLVASFQRKTLTLGGTLAFQMAF